MLDVLRRKYDAPGESAGDLSGTMLFADYMEHWLKCKFRLQSRGCTDF